MYKSGDKWKISGREWFGLMYTGEYNHTIDTKGRMIIPAKYREALGERFMITRGVEHNLSIYDMTQWEEYVEKLSSLPGNGDARKMVRFIVAGAVEAELDKQGRILVPANLREWAGIAKDVVLAGVIGHIEVWSKEKYEEATAFDNMDDIAEHMAELGLGV